MVPDSELLRRYAAENSEAAFAELVARHLDLVYSAALRQVAGDAHAAQDVAQVVFTTLARKAAAVAGHPVLAGWLYTTTHLAAAKLRRTEGRRRERETEAWAMNENSPDLAAADWDRLQPVLDAAMRELRDADRAAVLLRYFARRPFAEIGATLQVSEDGARMRVDRALEKLRGLLARRGVTSTAAALALVLTNQAVASAPAGLAAQLTGSALAGAGATATSGLLYFMSTTKFLSVTAAALVVLALGGVYYEVNAQHRAQARLELAQREFGAAQERQRALAARLRGAERDTARLQASLDAARAGAGKADNGAAGKSAPAPSAAAVALEAGEKFLAAHPAVRQALMDRSRARVASRFYPLYAKLKLTPDQIERFETLLIEFEGLNMGGRDVTLALRPGKGMTRDEVEAGVRELLGENGFKDYQDAWRVAGAGQFTTALAAALYYTSTPLTAQQAEQLVRLIVDSPRAAGVGTTSDWEQLTQRARAFLSEPQIAVVHRLRAQEEFGVAMKALALGK